MDQDPKDTDRLLDFFIDKTCIRIISFFLRHDSKFYSKKDLALYTNIPIRILDKYMTILHQSKYKILVVKNQTFEWHAHHVHVYKLNTDIKYIKTIRQFIHDLEVYT